MDSIPDDVLTKLKGFNDAITEFENTMEEFLKVPYIDPQRASLEKARLDLTSLFALNSLYWTYEACHGKQPKDQENLSIELKRVKEYMGLLKKFDEQHLRPKLNARGAKAFVRNALFDVNADEPPTQERSKRIRNKNGDNTQNEDWDGSHDGNTKKRKTIEIAQ